MGTVGPRPPGSEGCLTSPVRPGDPAAWYFQAAGSPACSNSAFWPIRVTGSTPPPTPPIPASTSPTSPQSTGSSCAPFITIAKSTLFIVLFVHSASDFVTVKLITCLGSFVSPALHVYLSSPLLALVPAEPRPQGGGGPGRGGIYKPVCSSWRKKRRSFCPPTSNYGFSPTQPLQHSTEALDISVKDNFSVRVRLRTIIETKLISSLLCQLTNNQ